MCFFAAAVVSGTVRSKIQDSGPHADFTGRISDPKYLEALCEEQTVSADSLFEK